MRFAPLAAVFLTAASGVGAAWAQNTAPAAGPPMLHLGAAGHARVVPDQLMAALAAVGEAPSPVAAQRRVNALMAGAAADARKVAGVTAAFGAYGVSVDDHRPPNWTARQTLDLRGGEAEVLLDLVGRLQAEGLVIEGLGWQLSDTRQEAAQDAATEAALAALRHRADLAAQALGMAVDHVQDVRLEPGPFPQPLRRMSMPMALSAAAMPPPNATPDVQEITVQVSADVVLKPAH